MGIYGHRLDNYIDNQLVTEDGGLLSKLFSKLKKPIPAKFKKININNLPKYNTEKIKEKFEKDYKLTDDVLKSGFDIFEVVKTKEDFEKMIKSVDSQLYKKSSDTIFYTFCYQFDVSDSDSSNFDELINAAKKEKESSKDTNDKRYCDNAIKILTFAKQKSLLIIELDTDSLYYNKSDKDFYYVDYKGRIDFAGSIDDILENRI